MQIKIPVFKDLNGDMLIFLAMLIFGTYSLFLRFFPRIPVLAFIFSLQVVGTIAFFPAAKRQGLPKLRKSDWWLLAALAVAATLNDLCYFFAFRFTTVANAAIAHQMVSVFLLFLAPLLLREKTKKNEWWALAVSLIGIVIIYSGGVNFRSVRDFWGITLGLSSALFYALIVILYRYLPAQGLSISAINLWRFTFSTIMLVPIMLAFGGFDFTASDLIPLVLFGLIFAFIASGIHNFERCTRTLGFFYFLLPNKIKLVPNGIGKFLSKAKSILRTAARAVPASPDAATG